MYVECFDWGRLTGDRSSLFLITLIFKLIVTLQVFKSYIALFSARHYSKNEPCLFVVVVMIQSQL